MRFLLTSDAGLEDVAADEAREAVPGAAVVHAPFGVPGQVAVEPGTLEALLRLSTVHHVIELRAEGRVDTIDELCAVLEGAELPELGGAASFRVTTERAGLRELDRVAVQRAAGGVLQRRYGTPVDLERPEVNVRVDVAGAWVVAGIQRTERSLGYRLRRARPLRSSLKPTSAAALIRLSGAHRRAGRLVDPMCGAGTIPFEAVRANPGLRVEAGDWDQPTVRIARDTLAGHGLSVDVRQIDARRLHDAEGGVYDFIVTDPPYGVRQAKRTSLLGLYGDLLHSFEQALAPAGRLVTIVVKFRVFEKALAGTGLRVLHERTVETGSLQPRIYVLGLG